MRHLNAGLLGVAVSLSCVLANLADGVPPKPAEQSKDPAQLANQVEHLHQAVIELEQSVRDRDFHAENLRRDVRELENRLAKAEERLLLLDGKVEPLDAVKAKIETRGYSRKHLDKMPEDAVRDLYKVLYGPPVYDAPVTPPARPGAANPHHPRYGDPLRNLPSWELEMMESGKSAKEIEDEWDRRYAKPKADAYDPDEAGSFGGASLDVPKPEPWENGGNYKLEERRDREKVAAWLDGGRKGERPEVTMRGMRLALQERFGRASTDVSTRSDGKVVSEETSDGYYFEDEKTGKLIEVSGPLVIEQL